MSSIDVIAIKQPDGSIKSSPFYVRFNSPAASRSKVSIFVNDRFVDFKKFIVEQNDYHARFEWKNPINEWEGDFWPVFMSWQLNIDAKTDQEEKRKFLIQLMDRILPRKNFLASMKLNDGWNTIRFVSDVTGEATESRIFLWPWYKKLVVSDIDGTITSSGEVFSRFSEYYTKYRYIKHCRAGIAHLYSAIVRNGYNIFYLTGRPLVQAAMMREFLESIRQSEDYRMPLGPVLPTPYGTYLSRSFKVWRGEPDEFKMTTLKCIRGLFPSCVDDPFAAGFGNTQTDIASYIYAGISSNRCFIVNKDDNTIKAADDSYEGYSAIGKLVDSIFPMYADKIDLVKDNNKISSS